MTEPKTVICGPVSSRQIKDTVILITGIPRGSLTTQPTCVLAKSFPPQQRPKHKYISKSTRN